MSAGPAPRLQAPLHARLLPTPQRPKGGAA